MNIVWREREIAGTLHPLYLSAGDAHLCGVISCPLEVYVALNVMLWFGQVWPLVDRCSPQWNDCLSRAYQNLSQLRLTAIQRKWFHLPLWTCVVRFKWAGTSKCSNFLMLWFFVNPWVTRPECSSLIFKGVHGLELFSILHLRIGILMNVECIVNETGEDFISIPFHSVSPCTGRWCRP